MPNMPALLQSPPIPQLSADGAIENQPAFRRAAKSAYYRTLMNTQYPTEAGFTVGADGKPSTVKVNQSTTGDNGALQQPVTPGDVAAFHTHPDAANYGQQPSPADISAAKRLRKPIMVASQKGLFEIDAQGNVRQVFKGTDWMNKK